MESWVIEPFGFHVSHEIAPNYVWGYFGGSGTEPRAEYVVSRSEYQMA